MTELDTAISTGSLGTLIIGLYFGGPLGITLAILAACAGIVWLVLSCLAGMAE